MQLPSTTFSAFARTALFLSSLTAVAGQDVCQNIGVYGYPEVQVYPVSISTYISAATVFNINGNADITINNAPTVLQTVVTATTTVTSFSTTTVTAGINGTATNGGAAGTGLPAVGGTVATIDVPILLQGAPASSSRIMKRQANTNMYISGGVPRQQTCQTAGSFTLKGGILAESGLVISADPGADFGLLAGRAGNTGLDETFTSENGRLTWRNAAFDNGVARYCSTGSAVYAIFRGNGPLDCTPYIITVAATTSCPGYTGPAGATTPLTTPSGTATVTGGTTGPVTPTSTGLISSLVNTGTSTSSVSSATATANPTVPANLPPDSTPVVVAFNLPPGFGKRQATTTTPTRYLKSDGTFTSDKTQAVVLGLLDGQLFAGQIPYSTVTGTSNQVFSLPAQLGDITTEFSVTNGLVWNNAAFTIDPVTNNAQFAVVGGTVYVAFNALPSGAVVIAPTASAIPRSAASSSAAAASSSAPASSNGGSATTSGTGTATATGSSTGSGTTSSVQTTTGTTTAATQRISDASSIIRSSSLTSFCSSYLSYSSGTATVTVSTTVGGATFSTTVSTTSTATVTSSTTTATSTTTVLTSTSTSTVATSVINAAKRQATSANSTPTGLQPYSNSEISAACSANVAQPTNPTSTVSATSVAPTITNTAVSASTNTVTTTFTSISTSATGTTTAATATFSDQADTTQTNDAAPDGSFETTGAGTAVDWSGTGVTFPNSNARTGTYHAQLAAAVAGTTITSIQTTAGKLVSGKRYILSFAVAGTSGATDACTLSATFTPNGAQAITLVSSRAVSTVAGSQVLLSGGVTSNTYTVVQADTLYNPTSSTQTGTIAIVYTCSANSSPALALDDVKFRPLQ